MKPSPTTAGAAWRDPWIATALLAALALRVTMARGGLWLDEAWSAVMAHDVGTPMGVIAGINHDNNHPLNSWWLQLVGLGAPPLLARALSIICSVGIILPAATFATRRGAAAGRAAAWLFALSPTLVLLGSEARGYAPALLALVILVDQVDPLRDGPPPSPTTLAMIGLFGTLGHLLMLPAICLVGGWLFLLRWDWRAAARGVGPALAGSLLVAGLLFGAAFLVQSGMTIGSTTRFGWPGFSAALVDLVQMTLGVGGGLFLLLTVVGPRPERTEIALWIALGLGLPLAAALFHPPNTQLSRYFVMSSLALLWLVATRFGAQIQGRRVHRVVACALLGGILLAMATTDARVIGAARGEPDLPVRLVAADHRGPARILIAADPLSAVIVAAAAERRVATTAVGPACAPADYLFAGLFDLAPQATIVHCGTRWSLMDYRAQPFGSGMGWVLYRRAGSSSIPLDRRAGLSSSPLNRRTGLPAPGVVASGPRPAL